MICTTEVAVFLHGNVPLTNIVLRCGLNRLRASYPIYRSQHKWRLAYRPPSLDAENGILRAGCTVSKPAGSQDLIAGDL